MAATRCISNLLISRAHLIMNSNQLRSLYLLNLTHQIPLNPLSHSYSFKLEEFNNEKQINYPEPYTNGTKICVNCGQVHLPGVNLHIRRKNTNLIYKCLNCKHSQKFKLPSTNHKPDSPVVPDETNKSQNKPQDLKNTKNNKKDKKRKNNLQNLLQQKKKQKNSTSLNLMEFMQQ